MTHHRGTSRMLRVFICGAHSVGKTTLVNEIAKQTQLHVESEVARSIIRRLNLQTQDFDPKINPGKFEELQRGIVEAQCEIERQNVALGRVYIADRGIDPIIYSIVYLEENATKRLLELPSTKECIERFRVINRYKSSLVFVVKPFQECIQEDTVRLSPKMEELLQFTEAMEAFLLKTGICYTLIDVLDLQSRVQIVMKKIEDEVAKR